MRKATSRKGRSRDHQAANKNSKQKQHTGEVSVSKTSNTHDEIAASSHNKQQAASCKQQTRNSNHAISVGVGLVSVAFGVEYFWNMSWTCLEWFMKFWLNSKYRKCPTPIIAEHVGGDIIVIVGMGLAISDTVLCRIRVC